MSEVLSLLDYLDESIGRLSVEIDRVIAPFAEHRDRLASAPGIDKRMAEAIIGEIGVDMTKFPTAAHLASWAGMCPGQHESAGKARHGTARHGNSWLQRHLTVAAMSASRTKDTYLAPQYRRIAGRRGKLRARKAVGHSLLVGVWHILAETSSGTTSVSTTTTAANHPSTEPDANWPSCDPSAGTSPQTMTAPPPSDRLLPPDLQRRPRRSCRGSAPTPWRTRE